MSGKSSILLSEPAQYTSNDHDEVSYALYKELIASGHADELHKLMQTEYCDIEPGFLGFIKTYKQLSEMIPLHFTVIDIGCGYGVQGWLFRHHKKYIGVDKLRGRPMIKFDNAEYFDMHAKEFFELKRQRTDWTEKLPLMQPIFAICNYVPSVEAHDLVRKNYQNVYTFYPAH